MKIAQKLWFLIAPEHHRKAVTLLGLMLMGMVLETMGVGIIVPALALMTQDNLAAKYPELVPWLSHFGNPSHEQLVIFGMIILVGVYAFKAIFLGFLAWWQACFTFEFQRNLSQRLFSAYLHQPYIFHLQRNSAQLIRNAVGQVTNVTNVCFQGILLITEILVLLGIMALLLVIEPLGALIVLSTLGLTGWGFHRFTRGRLLRWGKAYQLHEGLRIQHLQQGLGGAKDVKLLGREHDFLEQYQLHNTGSAKAAQYQATLQALPRLGLELIAVTGLVLLVFAMIAQGKPLGTLLPTLGLFAAAAFRLMPSVNRVLVAVQSIRFTLPAIDTLYREFSLLSHFINTPKCKNSILFKNALTLNDVVFSYPSTEVPILRDINLIVPRGASIGFIGESGAGKSTLVDVILGLLYPSSGVVKVDGVDIQENLRNWQDQIGYVPQTIFLTDDTLRRNIAFGIPNEKIDEVAVWNAIHAAQLDKFVLGLPQGLETMVGERGVRLSGGQRQRIGIARALYHDPSILVLDEATSSLDVDTESGVMDAVRDLKGDKTIIIVAHRLSTVEHCDYIHRLVQGLIEDGKDSLRILDKAQPY